MKDRFGKNSSPKAFLDDQRRHKLFTRSPSIFSELKTSLREAYQRLGSETSPAIGLTYYFLWAKFGGDRNNVFTTFSIIEPHGPVFTGAVRNMQTSRAERVATCNSLSIFNWGLSNFVILSSSRCTRYAITRKDWDEFKEITDWKHNKIVLKYFAWITQPYVNGTWNEVNELFCFYKKIHPVRIQRGKITSEVHTKKFPSRTKNNTQQVGRLRARQRNLQTLRPTNWGRACAAKVRLLV